VPAGAPANHRFDPSDDFLGMTRLAEPIVGSGPKTADALRHGRSLAANDEGQVREHPADGFDEVPRGFAENRRVDHDRVQLHCDELVGRDGARKHAVLPPRGLEPLREDPDEAAVGVDDGKPDGAWLSVH
jgi:hypothetical protein